MSLADAVRMARQCAQSLQLAGVEWLEKSPEMQIDNLQLSIVNCQSSSPAVASVEEPCDAPAGSLSLEQRRQALRVLNEGSVIGCTKCAVLVKNRTQTVFGVGSPAAELCFVGEAPGADEDRQGEPFVGAAGQLLTRIIENALKMRREDVYICNVLKCRPPGNRTPLPDEVANCSPFLERQIELIQPKYICALGAVAAQSLLRTTQSIGKLRGGFHAFKGIPVLCTYHPAYLLRSPEKKREVWDDMKVLLAKMGRPVP